MAAVEQHTQYKRELHPGDAISIRSMLLEIKEKSIRMMHEMRHDASDQVAAITEIVGIHIDATLRKAVSIPEDVRRRAIRVREDEFAAILGAM